LCGIWKRLTRLYGIVLSQSPSLAASTFRLCRGKSRKADLPATLSLARRAGVRGRTDEEDWVTEVVRMEGLRFFQRGEG